MLNVNLFCFSASYAIALALEITGIWLQFRWRRVLLLLCAAAGMVAHTWYLTQRVGEAPVAPLASHHDWFLAAAWALAAIYLAGAMYYPRAPLGLFLLPGVLALVGAATMADSTPLATAEGSRLWGRMHGVCLMLGALAVMLGFVAGLMYLLQSAWLKQKQTPLQSFRLPSLEWLERMNSTALGVAAMLVGGGFVTGVLSQMARQGEGNEIPWTDPVVLSLGAMLLWLVVAELFRLIYPAARRGRKVAYLTIVALAFLILALASVMFDDSLHLRNESAEASTSGAAP